MKKVQEATLFDWRMKCDLYCFSFVLSPNSKVALPIHFAIQRTNAYLFFDGFLRHKCGFNVLFHVKLLQSAFSNS